MEVRLGKSVRAIATQSVSERRLCPTWSPRSQSVYRISCVIRCTKGLSSPSWITMTSMSDDGWSSARP